MPSIHRPYWLPGLLCLLALGAGSVQAEEDENLQLSDAIPQVTAARSATDAMGTLLVEIQTLSVEVHEISRRSRTGLTEEDASALAERSAELARKATILQARASELRRLVGRLEQQGNALEAQAARSGVAPDTP